MNKKGFVSIIALGVFTLLTVFGIIISGIVSRTYQNVRNTDDNLAAHALATSAIEMLEQDLQNYGPGYNSGTITCTYNSGQAADNQHPYCNDFATLIGPDDDVQLTLKITGSNSEGTDLESARCGPGLANLRPCYTVPLPSTGNAGENCELYQPVYDNQGSNIVDESLSGREDVDQVDFACNWNKLALGSDLTKGTTIPLYKDNGGELSHPFIDQDNANFYLRLRTPCDCGPNDVGCSQNACTPQQRYEIEEIDQVMVDWQISGLCNGVECSLVSAPKEDVLQLTGEWYVDSLGHNFINMEYLENSGINNSVHPAESKRIRNFLPTLTEPKLTLVLTGMLPSANNQNIPYLEYQLLANFPASAPGVEISASVNQNGNLSTADKYIPLKGEVIDFAIQN